MRQQWPFPVVMATAFGICGVLVAVPYLVRRIQ